MSPPHALLGGEIRLALILDTVCLTVQHHLTHQRRNLLIGRIGDSGDRLHQSGHGVLLALVGVQERLDVSLDTLVCHLRGGRLLVHGVLAVEQFQLVVQEARHISTGNLDSGITLGDVIGGVHIHLGQNGGEVVALGQAHSGSSVSHSINPFCVFRCRHHIVVFLLEHLYYNTPPKPCQDFFSDLWNFFRGTRPAGRSYPLPWNNYILPHPWADCNSQYSQKMGFSTSKICAKKHLTKFAPRGIMEISGATAVSARPILTHLSAFVNRQFAQK